MFLVACSVRAKKYNYKAFCATESNEIAALDTDYCTCSEMCNEDAECYLFAYGDANVDKFQCYLYKTTYDRPVESDVATKSNYFCYTNYSN